TLPPRRAWLRPCPAFLLVLRTITFTLLALVAFASNSLLTRSALGTGAIDAATFTAIRLLAGAATLVALARVRDGAWTALRGGTALGPAALFAYAVPFSLAYVRIGAAVGALVLFGVVLLAEPLSLRLLLAAAAVLGGIGLLLSRRRRSGTP